MLVDHMTMGLNTELYACSAMQEHDEEKIISILQKTWVKMGKRGQELALQMDLSDRAKELVGKALSG